MALSTLDFFVTAAFFLMIGAALAIYFAIFLSTFRDAPFVPSSRQVADAMMVLAAVRPGEMVVDLGSGHGEILLAALRREARAVGYEQSWLLGSISRVRKFMSMPRGSLRIHCENLTRADLRETDVVTCYLFPKILERLRTKFEAELRPGSRVVSAWFPIHAWTPREVVQIAGRPIYLYMI